MARLEFVGVPEHECRFGSLTLSDLDVILTIERESHRYPWTEAVFRDCFKEGYELWGLWSTGELTAFAILSWQYDELHLLNLCVRRDHRRSGLGRRLLRFAIANARASNARCLLLEVRESNTPALNLYRQEGFAEVGHRKDYYPADDGREHAVVMALSIP